MKVLPTSAKRPLGSSLDQTKELIELYRETAAEEGYEMGPQHIGYLIRCFVADTSEKAQEQGYNFFWQNGALNKQIREWMAPPGYATVDVAGGHGVEHVGHRQEGDELLSRKVGL